MTTQLLCGFEGFDGTIDGTDSFPSATGSVGTSYSRWAGGRGCFTINGEHGPDFPVPPSATMVLGFAAQPQTQQANQRSLCAFRYKNGWQIDCVLTSTVGTNGYLVFYRGSAATGAGGTVIATQSTTFDRTAWHYFQIRVLISATVGTIELVIDGSLVQTWTGLNTQGMSKGAFVDQVSCHGGLAKFGGIGGNWNVHYDDVYADDADFLGDLRLAPKVPSGNGNYTAWTPSTGTDHAVLVDEIPPNTTDYNSSATLNDIDSLTYGAVGVTGTILGVVPVPVGAIGSGEAYREIAAFARLSSTDLVGPTLAVPESSYWCERYRALMPTKPGGGAWTVTDVDNAEFGYKLVT